MAKVKALLPSLREKKRYVVFEIISKNKIKAFSTVSKSIWQGMLGLNGQLGAARAGLWVLPDKYNHDAQRGIVRVNHKMTDELKAAFTFIKEMENQPVIVRGIKTSGTLNKAEKHVAA